MHLDKHGSLSCHLSAITKESQFFVPRLKLHEAETRIAALEAQNAALLSDVNQDEGYERLKARCAQLEAALRRAVNPWTHHFGWCAKNGQMPMVHDKMYTSPDDWDAWRATIACTCAVAELLPTSMETGAKP